MSTRKPQESQVQYLIRNGWCRVTAAYSNGKLHPGDSRDLWFHQEPGLRRIDGMPMFKREAVAAQLAKDRRGVAA